MLKFSEIFEFSRENSYFERIRTVRMVRMVRSLADRTFQLWYRPGMPLVPFLLKLVLVVILIAVIGGEWVFQISANGSYEVCRENSEF